jgi:DNA-binding PadR family transcriptional regulator
MVLLAIWRLKDKAYGVSIRRQILKDAEKDYTYGTLYGLLRQLAHKDYVKMIKGEPTPEKGGRSKSFFKLTPKGIQALKDALKLHRRIWKDTTEFSLDKL